MRRHKALFLVASPEGEEDYTFRIHSCGNITYTLGMIEIGRRDLLALDKKLSES